MNGSKKEHKETTKYLQMSENKSTRYQNLWDAATVVLEGNLQLQMFTLKVRKMANQQPNFTNILTLKLRYYREKNKLNPVCPCSRLISIVTPNFKASRRKKNKDQSRD